MISDGNVPSILILQFEMLIFVEISSNSLFLTFFAFFSPKNLDKFATLDTMHALCLPLGASISLLVMFFFFDSMQMLFAVCTAIIATIALAFLLLPMCQYIIRPCSDGSRISFGLCGRFSAAELFSFSLAVSIVCIWVLTGHWLLMDGM